MRIRTYWDIRWAVWLTLWFLIAGAATAAEARPLEFQVSFDQAVFKTAFTGRVYVMLSKRRIERPPPGPNWFNPEPFYALDVKDWKPDEPAVLAGNALGFPSPLADLSKGTYWVQAIMDFSRGISFSATEGNGYSQAVQADLDPMTSGPVKLRIDQVYHERPFRETDHVKLVELESKLLSAFEGCPVKMRAGVVLPKSFATDAQKKYPVIYEIPGFGGNHFMASFAAVRNATDVAGTEMLYVVLDPSCRLGHHVFADSDNNGPRGRALVEELIPHIEKKFRGLGLPAARFVTGHSSGGWSSLWLQVTYPGFFGGVWSTAPDPVDFRDFQRIDIYKPGTNMFMDEAGQPRPIARSKDRPTLFYKSFSDMEVVMGHGGQLGSFEAVFSSRGADGKPRLLWDRKTGQIDAEAAKSWERYDIRLILERNWKTLGPKLAGKLHVYVGAEDTFYLEGAVALLKKSLADASSDAVVEIVSGRNHGSLVDRSLRQRIDKEMADQFRKHSSPLR
jgi:S-formylglutathione hydrolase FrmB